MKRIMIVDDNIQLAEQMKNALVRQSNEVVAVFSGMEFLRQFEIFKPDLLVIYTNMPNMDGVALLKKVKEEYPNIPIVFITAFGRDKIVVEAMKIGLSNFIEKPFKMDAVISTINQYIKRG